MFYRKGLELGLLPDQIKQIKLRDWYRIAESGNTDPDVLDLDDCTPEQVKLLLGIS